MIEYALNKAYGKAYTPETIPSAAPNMLAKRA